MCPERLHGGRTKSRPVQCALNQPYNLGGVLYLWSLFPHPDWCPPYKVGRRIRCSGAWESANTQGTFSVSAISCSSVSSSQILGVDNSIDLPLLRWRLKKTYVVEGPCSNHVLLFISICYLSDSWLRAGTFALALPLPRMLFPSQDFIRTSFRSLLNCHPSVPSQGPVYAPWFICVLSASPSRTNVS